jgi:O-methyltransferase
MVQRHSPRCTDPEHIIAAARWGSLCVSTRDALVNLYHKVSPGGFVIVDDYNSWGGCQAAINDFRKERGITEPLVEIDSHCVLWQINREGTRVR